MDYVRDGNILDEDYECNYLGVTFTKDLQWGVQIDKVVAKDDGELHFIIRVLGKSMAASK